MNHDDVQRTYESQTPIQLAGTISDTGETFVSDKGGKSWTIINPDAVKGHKGEHVFLTANVDADKKNKVSISITMRLLSSEIINALRANCRLVVCLPVMFERESLISCIRRSPNCPIQQDDNQSKECCTQPQPYVSRSQPELLVRLVRRANDKRGNSVGAVGTAEKDTR
jgi:hypothetical protein